VDVADRLRRQVGAVAPPALQQCGVQVVEQPSGHRAGRLSLFMASPRVRVRTSGSEFAPGLGGFVDISSLDPVMSSGRLKVA
jgi:hypothetical protein